MAELKPTTRQYRVLRFTADETVRWISRFGVDPSRVTRAEIIIDAPGLVGHVRLDIHLEDGDLDALDGDIEAPATQESLT